MPVIPPVRTILLNDHKDLAEGELHYPKGYTLAGRESYPIRNVHGELDWQFKYYQEPVIGFTSVGSTVNDGDRYIFTGVGSSAEFGGASTNDIVSYLTVDSYGQNYDSWDFITPLAGTLVYASSLDAFYYYDGSSWQSLVSGNTGKEPDSITKTFAGSNIGTYIDLYTPTVGNEIERILFKGSSITPTDAIIKVVLHDGTPANDVDITAELFAAEFNDILYNSGANGQTVVSGFSLKLLVSGNDIDTGTLKVISYYLP